MRRSKDDQEETNSQSVDGVDGEDEDEEEEVDRELLALREELEELDGKVQEEKALSDKADSDRRIVQEQKLMYDEEIEKKTQELGELEKECETLMVEGRMYQLASREYDMPLKETWTDKPEQALVVDLSKISRTLDQAVRAVTSKDPAGSSQVTASRRSEIEVVHVNDKGVELAKTNIPISPISTFGEILSSACAYWSLNSELCELENAQGRKLVRRDVVPADITQLFLKDRVVDDDDQEAAQDEDSNSENRLIQNDNTRLQSNNGGGGDGQIVGPFSTELDSEPIGEDVQVGKDAITSRDSRICYHLEFLIVILLATTFASMSLEFRRVGEAFGSREAIKRIFADQPVIDSNNLSTSEIIVPQPAVLDYNFFEVFSQAEMWQWMDQTAYLFGGSSPLVESNCPLTSLNRSLSITDMTISQLRVNPNQGCSQVRSSENCYASFSSPQQDVPFASVSANPLVAHAFVYNATRAQPGMCTAWPSLVTDTFPGFYAYYPAHELDYYSLRLDRTLAQEQVQALKDGGWVDLSTRMITVEFTTFERTSGAFVNVIAAFEYLPNGAIVPRWNSIPFFLQVNDDSYDLVFLVISLIIIGTSFLSYILFGFYGLGIVFLDMLLLIFVVLYFVGNQQLDLWFETCQKEVQAMPDPSNALYDFRGMAFQSQMIGNFQGIIITLFAIRLLRYLAASPSSSLLTRSMSKAFHQYVSLYFFVFVFASCFALMAHFIFGRSFYDFFVIDLSFASLWISFTVGKSAAYVGTAQWGAIVLSVAAYIALFLGLFFICFAVTAGAYISVKDEVRRRGYYWMANSRPAQRYADEISGTSGTIKGTDAEARLKTYQAGKRTFGQD